MSTEFKNRNVNHEMQGGYVNGKPHTWSKKSAVFSGGEY